ncbi:MAG: AMP-binding protein, partial [Mucispirillum sp.]|nr:AMP-binding protein [Mucispirillum sp.]
MRYSNLGEMMTIQAKRWKNKPFVYFGDKVYTYMQVEKMANKAARMLKEKGLKKGDKVAVIMENSAHYIISLVTIFKTGAVAIPVNNMLRESEFAY